MKKVLATATALGIMSLPLIAMAQPDVPGWNQNVDSTLENIGNWLFATLMVIAFIFLIIAGYFFVTAQGDPEKVKTARNFVLYAVIGVLVALISRGLIMLVDELTA